MLCLVIVAFPRYLHSLIFFHGEIRKKENVDCLNVLLSWSSDGQNKSAVSRYIYLRWAGAWRIYLKLFL